MSTSILYHCFGASQYKYLKTEYQNGKIYFHIIKSADKRRCVDCGSRNTIKKGIKLRYLKTVPVGNKAVYLVVHRQRLECLDCGSLKYESLDLALPKKHWTKTLGKYIISLLRCCTIKDVSRHLNIHWDTVKEIHSLYLRKEFKKRRLSHLRYLGVDELAIRKGHNYLTIVIDLETGEVVWVGRGRSKYSLSPFLKKLRRVKAPIKAIAMDMWAPYIEAVKEYFPEDVIVFDRFHVISGYNKMLDKLRAAMANEAIEANKKIFKGVRYLLLMDSEKLKKNYSQRIRLDELLRLNKPLYTAYVLKEELLRIWKATKKKNAIKRLNNWLWRALKSSIIPLVKFAKTLIKHYFGIISYFDHKITTGMVEGIINKIKTLKRQAYGYRDIEYFELRIYFINKARYSLVG